MENATLHFGHLLFLNGQHKSYVETGYFLFLRNSQQCPCPDFIYLTNLKRYNRRQYFIEDVQFVSQHITTSECLFITLK